MFRTRMFLQTEEWDLDWYDDWWDDDSDKITDSEREIPYFDLEQNMYSKMKKKFQKKHFAF